MKITNKHLNIALHEAQKTNVRRGKIACLILSTSGKVITKAHNLSVFGDCKRFTIHAEQAAIAKALKINAANRYGKLTALVVRYKPSTRTASMAKPCEVCQSLLSMAEIDAYYTDKKGLIRKL